MTAIDLRIGRHVESFTWSELSVLLGLALLPVEHLLLRTLAVAVAYLLIGQPLVTWILDVGSYAVGMALTAGLCRAVTTPSWDHPVLSAVALLAGAAAWAVWNEITTDTAIALAQDRPLAAVLTSELRSTVVVFLCNVGLAFGCLGLAQVHLNLIWAAPACIVLAAVLNRCYLELDQDRAAWRALENTSRELTPLDEEVLIGVALTRVTAPMQADGAELRLSTAAHEVAHRLGHDTGDLGHDTGDLGHDTGDGGRGASRQVEPPTVTVARALSRAGLPVDHTEASVPLDGGEERLGSLVVTYDGAVRLTRRERSQLTAYAGSLAVALCNARLHAQVRRQAERSAHAALHDPLTGLPNRTLLRSHVEAARGERQAFALLLLDLDEFKPANDELGHEAGDEVLRVTASRLRAAVRPTDVVVRLGGDEFAVLLHDTTDVSALVSRLEAVVAVPVGLGTGTVSVGASVGHALHAVDGTSLEALLRAADADMYRVKRARTRRALGPRRAVSPPRAVPTQGSPHSAAVTSRAATAPVQSSAPSAGTDVDATSALRLVGSARRR